MVPFVRSEEGLMFSKFLFMLLAIATVTACSSNETSPITNPSKSPVISSVTTNITTKPSGSQVTSCNPAPYNGHTPAGVKEWTNSSQANDGSVFLFRGNKIGDPINTMFPCYQKNTAVVGASNYCDPDNRGTGFRVCHDKTTSEIGDMRIESLDYLYLDE